MHAANVGVALLTHEEQTCPRAGLVGCTRSQRTQTAAALQAQWDYCNLKHNLRVFSFIQQVTGAKDSC